MHCLNCRAEVDATNGYCNRCGTALSARLCPNGHVMDPSWSECKYCPPSARAGGVAGGKGRTLAENGPDVAPPPRAFAKGATLLEGPGGGRSGRTVGAAGGRPSAGPRDAGNERKRTVFDPGLAEQGTAAPAAPKPRLVGWLVSFDLDPSGYDLRVREGRNLIGADANEVDLHVDHDSISSRHAVIMYRDGKFQLRDHDSTNGTYLNGEDVFGRGAVPLDNRDRLRLGSIELTFYVI